MQEINPAAAEPVGTCPICSKVFYKHCNLNSHRRAHGYGLDCDICKKPHPSLEDLLLHIERVHDPQVGYICDSCQKRFSQMEKLLTHIETDHNPTGDGVEFTPRWQTEHHKQREIKKYATTMHTYTVQCTNNEAVDPTAENIEQFFNSVVQNITASLSFCPFVWFL